MSSEDEGNLLALLLDVNLFAASADPSVPPPDIFLQQLLIFVNSYLLLSDSNHIAALAVHAHGAPFLHTTARDAHPTGSDEAACTSAASPADQIKERLGQVLNECQQSAAAAGSSGDGGASQGIALSGALSRALCYAQRCSRELAGVRRRRSKPRVLVIVSSPDAPAQYIPTMNAIFSAQRAGVVVDAVVMADADSGFLQQASHLTGGLYLRPRDRNGLLQYLLSLFSADTHTRSMLSTVRHGNVDFRASCFCHKKPIDRGWVCSVCLSIFCERAPECSTCGTAFRAKKAHGRAWAAAAPVLGGKHSAGANGS